MGSLCQSGHRNGHVHQIAWQRLIFMSGEGGGRPWFLKRSRSWARAAPHPTIGDPIIALSWRPLRHQRMVRSGTWGCLLLIRDDRADGWPKHGRESSELPAGMDRDEPESAEAVLARYLRRPAVIDGVPQARAITRGAPTMPARSIQVESGMTRTLRRARRATALLGFGPLDPCILIRFVILARVPTDGCAGCPGVIRRRLLVCRTCVLCSGRVYVPPLRA